MNFSNYSISKKKNKNKSNNLKSKNGSFSSKKDISEGNEIPNQNSNFNFSMSNSNLRYMNDLPKLLQQENQGKLKILKSNSITDQEVNSIMGYNGYTSHDMRLLWTAFGNMPDEEKNTFIKGLVYRFGQRQIDLTCSLLNLKVEDFMTRTVIPSEYKNKIFKPKIKNIFEEEYIYNHDFLKGKLPAITNKSSEEKRRQDLLSKSHLYTQLLNQNFDCDEIKKQSENLSPEEIKICLEFACDRYLLLLIKSICKIVNGKYICCYSLNVEEGNSVSIQASNWLFSSSNTENTSPSKLNNNIPLSSIFAGKDIINKKIINSYNIYNSEYYTNEVANHYSIDMKCVLSTPIFAPDNCKVIGILEVINKKDEINDIPYFSVEDEYILKTMSSIWSIILRQCLIQENSEKHLDNFKNVFITTEILNNIMNIDELVKTSASLLKELTSSQDGHLFVLDEVKQNMFTILNDERKSFKSNLGIVGEVMHNGKTIKTHKVSDHPLYNKEVDDLFENITVKTMICVPVKNSEGKVIGVFQLINKLPDNKPYTVKDEVLISNYASLISSLLKKVFFYKLLKKTIKELKKNNNIFRNIVENFPNVILTLNSDGTLKSINQKNMMFYDNEIKLMQEKSYTQWLESYPMLVADITKISRRGGIAYAYNYDMSGDDGEPFYVNYTVLRFNKEDDPKYYGIFNDSVQLKINKLFESQDIEEDKEDHIMNIKNTMGRYINNINFLLNNNDYGLENTTMVSFENVSTEKRSMMTIENKLLIFLKISILLTKSIMGSTNVKEYMKSKDKNNKNRDQDITLLGIYIKNFNEIYQTMDTSERLTELTEKYLNYVMNRAAKNNGSLYRMKESKIIIGFGLITPSQNDIQNAINTAEEILKDQEIINHDLNIYPEIDFGLAITSGPAITSVINTNSKTIFNIYGNIMDVLEKQLKYTSKFYVNLLVTENVCEVAKNMFHTRKIFSIDISNKEYDLYSIESSQKEELSQDTLTTGVCYELGLAEFHSKNWIGALNHFKKSFILSNDGPSKAMMQRCEYILENSKMTLPT
ncbi:hypothetical protein LY90DRAFT_670343 [Neocallimastix californiae]|uniref:GAF domain-containing protein n=1 Tax=Neocallimastix californiae TaxID=1754190 RepID=A0A1Y2D219_9FUNG|nr:hypothetical protein LY90DRAFT_670343 [Neocallimastix californiae]|eukprot:ORY53322.1 hypothetical protein LY90DRAFT_670343 [Neocallimastix californiae]